MVNTNLSLSAFYFLLNAVKYHKKTTYHLVGISGLTGQQKKEKLVCVISALFPPVSQEIQNREHTKTNLICKKKKIARKVIHASSAFSNHLSIIFKNVAISLYVQRIFFSLSQ